MVVVNPEHRKIAEGLWQLSEGTIDTPEKFAAKRADSRECRNCHNFQSMDFAEQNTRSGREHQVAMDTNQTCIDCHQGIARALPPIEQHIGAPKANPADLGKPEITEPIQ
jgi:cytochrome c-type protein NapC